MKKESLFPAEQTPAKRHYSSPEMTLEEIRAISILASSGPDVSDPWKDTTEEEW